MNKMFSIVILFLISFCHAQEWQENEEIAKLFKKANLTGTFVLYDVSNNTYTGHDQARAETRFTPASTFKIPHSLIGLSLGAIKGIDEVFPYDGKPQFLKSWEKDMTLQEAMKLSNFNVYKAIAKRIGAQSMQSEVTKLHYGNSTIGSKIDEFWLDGSLKISAIEQVQFLAQLAENKLPFPTKIQEDVQKIILLEKTDRSSLYGKSGWGTQEKPEIGWWVGWVNTQGKNYIFALNIDMPTIEDAPKRIEIGKNSLKILKILE